MSATDWKPFPGFQTRFCQAGEFEVLAGGAAGPGKTDVLIALSMRHIDNPRYKALLLRRTFPRLQEILDRTWAMFPRYGGEYRTANSRWTFPSGASIRLGHMQHEDDKRNYHGGEFQFCGWDELTEFTETQYLFLFSRLRSAHDPDLPTRVRATTNPGGLGHRWVKERFVDIGKPESVHVDPLTGLSRCFIPGLVQDNLALMRHDPGYVSRLEALPEIERKRLLHGDWETFEGQVFRTLSARVHGCEPFDIPPEWERFMVFDWGFAKPFSCGWWAVDPDSEVLYRYREWYGCKEDGEDGGFNVGLRMVAPEVAQGILEREDPNERVRIRLADPSIWNKQPNFRRNELIGADIQSDMTAQGVFFMKASNDRAQGIAQVHKRLALELDVDKATGEILNERPRIKVFNTCKHWWRTMPMLQAASRNDEDVDTDSEDHIYDETRYACMYKQVKVTLPPKGAPSGTFQGERQRLIRARQYARSHGCSMAVAYQKIR